MGLRKRLVHTVNERGESVNRHKHRLEYFRLRLPVLNVQVFESFIKRMGKWFEMADWRIVKRC